MATRLEIAKQKLERLEKECDEATQSAYNHMKQTNGQPMNDKRNGNAFFNKRDQLEQRVFNKLHEIEAQKERISYLEEREYKKANHLTANYGLQTSVHNIEEFKKRKQTKATREKIELLEKIDAKAKEDALKMCGAARKLIEDGKVSQWQKQPIFYFVKGLKKVALVVDENGCFAVSKRYPTKDEKEECFIKELLEAQDGTKVD